MASATDCNRHKNIPLTEETLLGQEPELFSVGTLAKALQFRGYDCNKDTVKNFVSKRKIQPVHRLGNNRIFDRTTLELMRNWLKSRGKFSKTRR